MAHRSEQGNILGFVLVGALLVALLLGGIYVVRNTVGHVATDDGASAPIAANSDKESGKDATPAGDEGKTADNKTDEQRLKETLEAQSAAEKKAREQQAANKSDTATGKDGSTPAASSAGSLPATGPEEAVLPTLGAMLIAGTMLSYVRSRRLI